MAKRRNREEHGVIKKTWKDHVIDVLIAVVFGAFTLACIFPFYYIFINKSSKYGQNPYFPSSIFLFFRFDAFFIGSSFTISLISLKLFNLFCWSLVYNIADFNT